LKKHYTIKDIAEELNLHHTTVSRALRNHPDVNKETRKLVLDTAQKYNYVPNSFAKSLRSAKSKTIVVMVPVVKNFFFSEVLGIISNLAFNAGYSVMIYQSNEKGDIEFQNLESVMENRVAGVIASVANVEKNSDKYLQLENMGIPVVLFDRCYTDVSIPRVVIDNYQGSFDACEYLIQLGRKNIAFYRGRTDNPVFDSRFRGYEDALKKHDISFRDELVYKGGIELEDGNRLLRKIIDRKSIVDAMICVVDMVALGVITGARESDLEIPGDLALIGFDNEPAGRIIRPALTTVAQPVELVGRTAFDLLLEQIEGKPLEGREETILKMEFIKRTSA
jgi:DNA-binding LacI/PurR family transcriptional regulator